VSYDHRSRPDQLSFFNFTGNRLPVVESSLTLDISDYLESVRFQDNVKASRAGKHPKKPVFRPQSGFDMVFIS